jgi:hypothetical protein
VGLGLSLVGLAGLGAWSILGEGALPVVALVPPVAMLAAGVAVILWSRGIDAIADAELPTFAELPDGDPRHAEPLSVRRARWIWSSTMWGAWMCVMCTLAWLSKDAIPGWGRLVGFLATTLPFTVVGARWLEASNGESGWPAQ